MRSEVPCNSVEVSSPARERYDRGRRNDNRNGARQRALISRDNTDFAERSLDAS